MEKTAVVRTGCDKQLLLILEMMICLAAPRLNVLQLPVFTVPTAN